MPDIKVCDVCGDAHWADRSCPTCTNRAAPAELSRLRAEVERLREALDAIGKVAATAHRHRGNAGKEAFFLSVIEDRARKALEGGNE